MICHPYIPLHLEEICNYFIIFHHCVGYLYTVSEWFNHIRYPTHLVTTVKMRFEKVRYYLSLFSYFFRYAARGDQTRTASLQRYATNLYMLHSLVINRIHYYHNTCARRRSRRGTLSKMASFIVDSCRDLRFSLEMWDWRRTITWGRCTPLTIMV